MTLAPPLVSVIIPVYNGACFLSAAIDSIHRQDYRPIEIIVVDDGSTDDTRAVATRSAKEVRYVRQDNAGPPAARNTGLRVARGTCIGFLDADDLWTDCKLAIQVPRLMEGFNLEIVLGYTTIVPLADSADGNRTALAPRPLLSLGAALVRRSSFERTGLFDERLRYCDDVDWFLRAKEAGLSLRIHDDPVLVYRRHDRNLTNQRDLDRRSFAAALKRSLDRRRAAGGGSAGPLPPWFHAKES
jgi:glycosyltransferase involved in cell wall biosynthesis